MEQKGQPLSTTQAGARVGKHPRTVVSWIRKGFLPAGKMPGPKGPYLIDEDELMKFVEERYTPEPFSPDEQEK